MDVDLNLLRVLDTLIELRSVTRAADRLGLTQSAVSHALGRLRQALGDPLFVRGPGGLQPTARALEIAPGIREGLSRLRSALAPQEFDPANAHRRFTVAAGSYFLTWLVPRLLGRIRVSAPNVTLRVLPIADDLLTAMDEGRVDLTLGAFGKAPPRITIEPLFTEEMVWIAAAGHPVTRHPCDAATIAALPRITILASGPFDQPGTIRMDGGIERRIIAGPAVEEGGSGPVGDTTIVYDALAAISAVGQSDMVALVPRRFAERTAERDGIAILSTPDLTNGVEISMMWHNRLREDHGLAWLRSLVRDLID